MSLMSAEEPEPVTLASLANRGVSENWHVALGPHLALYQYAIARDTDMPGEDGIYYPVVPLSEIGKNQFDDFDLIVRSSMFDSLAELPKSGRIVNGPVVGVLCQSVEMSRLPETYVERKFFGLAPFAPAAQGPRRWILHEEREIWPAWQSVGTLGLSLCLIAWGCYLLRRQDARDNREHARIEREIAEAERARPGGRVLASSSS